MASSVALTKDTLTPIALAGSGSTVQLVVVSILFYSTTTAGEVGLYLNTNTTTPFAVIPITTVATVFMFPQLILSTDQKISAKADVAGTILTISTTER